MIPEIKLVPHPDTGELIQEEWRTIAGYEGYYEISNYGRVKSLSRKRKNGISENDFYVTKERLLKPGEMADTGYLSVSLISKTHSVHRLVAKTFLENPKGLLQVNHINRERQDNMVINLEWCSPRENTMHGHLKRKKSKYPGVGWLESRKRWTVYISINNKSKFFGKFKTELEAYDAYLKALKKHGIENKYAQVA